MYTEKNGGSYFYENSVLPSPLAWVLRDAGTTAVASLTAAASFGCARIKVDWIWPIYMVCFDLTYHT